MSELSSYVDRMLDEVRAPGASEREIAARVRALTQHALKRRPFVVECAEAVISAVASTRALRAMPPLWGTRSTPASLRIFYWPPGFQNEPHQHEAWGVTGVVFNEVVVETFPATTPPLESQRGEPLRTITARAGDAGYLVPPCVHRLRNETARTTVTFHVFGAESQASAAEHAPRAVQEPDVRRDVLLRRRVLCAWCEVLAELDEARSVSLLERIMVSTRDPRTKLEAIKALARHDPRRAYELSCDFERQLRGADRDGLSLINARLAAVCGNR